MGASWNMEKVKCFGRDNCFGFFIEESIHIMIKSVTCYGNGPSR